MKPCLRLCIAVPAALAFSFALGAAFVHASPETRDPGAIHPSKLPRDTGWRNRPRGPRLLPPAETRRIDGNDNNQSHPEWGSAVQALLRLVPPAYGDGVSTPSGSGRPSARAISNAVCAQTESRPNRRRASDFLWQWGQFLDHDIDETPGIDPPEYFSIEIPAGDPWFGGGTMPLNRSVYWMVDGVRQQLNFITSYIDASNVYGSDEERAAALRTNDGSGKLKTTPSPHGDLLPYNVEGLPNAMGPSPAFFLAGDVRANEQVGLTAMHTLFVREHNFWAEKYGSLNRRADGEECYQFARMMVAAEMQAITYREFLPLLLGPGAIPPYRGYRPDVNPGIANIFSTGAYRLGHSMLSPNLLRLDRRGREIAAGHLPLSAAFFDPSQTEQHGIEPVLRGLAAQQCQEIDMMLVDDVRNMLFGSPGSGGMDLAALNIQRGRDHGLPSYAQVCASLGFAPPADFHDINPDPAVWRRLEEVYGAATDVDCWVGGVCEPHVEGAMVGPMIHGILVDQFTRLRDGDRFFYRNHLPRLLVQIVEGQTLARIIRRNTRIGAELPDDVFVVGKRKGRVVRPAPGKLRPKLPGGTPPARRKFEGDDDD